MSLVAQPSRIHDFLVHLGPTSQKTLTAYSVTKDMVESAPLRKWTILSSSVMSGVVTLVML